ASIWSPWRCRFWPPGIPRELLRVLIPSPQSARKREARTRSPCNQRPAGLVRAHCPSHSDADVRRLRAACDHFLIDENRCGAAGNAGIRGSGGAVSGDLRRTDEWSIRFASAHPDAERVIYDRNGGQLSSVEHSATIPVENLKKFFFDTPISISVTRGEGWAELAIYAGTSTRATRQQREEVQTTLTKYSEYAARYFESVRSMYRYLDEKPQRALPMFTALFTDDKEKTTPPEISEREHSILENVVQHIDALSHANAEGADDREFDLVFNPFPAEIRVNLPTEPLAIEGFTRLKGGGVVVKTV